MRVDRSRRATAVDRTRQRTSAPCRSRGDFDERQEKDHTRISGMNRMSMKKTVSAVGGLTVIGVGVGCALGAATDNVEVGLAIGAALGILVGAGIDANRRRKGDDSSP